MKKEIGRTRAIAMTVVKPGKAPTNMPRNRPTAMMPKVSHRNRRKAPSIRLSHIGLRLP
jgi:hypothetical protein